jgi:hypothetical protein
MSHQTTVRRDPNSWNVVVFWSEWVVVSWARFYRIEDASIQTWFAFLFGSLAGKFPTGMKITVTRVRMTGIWVWLVLGGLDNMMDE